MKYAKVWKIIVATDLCAIAVLVVGIITGGVTGTALITLGAGVLVGASIGHFKEALIVGIVVGGALGYLTSDLTGTIIGILVGGAFGGGLGWMVEKWTKGKKEQIDGSLQSAISIMNKNKDATFEKIDEIDRVLEREGSHLRKKRAYLKDIKYIRQRMNSIRYKKNKPKSLENAVSQFIDLNGELDRLKLKIGKHVSFGNSDNGEKKKKEDKFRKAGARMLDAEKYAETFGSREEDEDEGGRWSGKKDSDSDTGPKKRIKPSKTYTRSLTAPKGKPVSQKVRKSIPTYEINLHISSGKFADIYFADNSNKEKVVIKVPRIKTGDLRDLSLLADFMSNVKQWKTLEHENIVGLMDSEIKPTPHMAMERMEGGDLDGLMKKHDLSLEETMHIMLNILKGVSYAHERSTVHRDLKPKNILFDKNGIPKISDWGWDRFISSSNPKKVAESRCKLAYCAPEQILPKVYGKIDKSTDLFQLGIIFYEMLTGKNPFFDVDRQGVISNIIDSDPAPPSSLNPDIPRELDMIVMRALSKRKAGRWKDVNMMYDKLMEIVESAE